MHQISMCTALMHTAATTTDRQTNILLMAKTALHTMRSGKDEIKYKTFYIRYQQQWDGLVCS